MDNYKKYIEYKTKYLHLKNLIGGFRRLNNNTGRDELLLKDNYNYLFIISKIRKDERGKVVDALKKMNRNNNDINEALKTIRTLFDEFSQSNIDEMDIINYVVELYKKNVDSYDNNQVKLIISFIIMNKLNPKDIIELAIELKKKNFNNIFGILSIIEGDRKLKKIAFKLKKKMDDEYIIVILNFIGKPNDTNFEKRYSKAIEKYNENRNEYSNRGHEYKNHKFFEKELLNINNL